LGFPAFFRNSRRAGRRRFIAGRNSCVAVLAPVPSTTHMDNLCNVRSSVRFLWHLAVALAATPSAAIELRRRLWLPGRFRIWNLEFAGRSAQRSVPGRAVDSSDSMRSCTTCGTGAGVHDRQLSRQARVAGTGDVPRLTTLSRASRSPRRRCSRRITGTALRERRSSSF
jgi:hypothetical protein